MSNTFEQRDSETSLPPDSNGIELFLSSDRDTRANVLLSHPQVLGFVYLNDDAITKTFLPERVIDWRHNTKSIAAVSGTPEDFVCFSLIEEALCGNNLFLCEKVKFHPSVKTISAYRFFKDNRKHLPFIPECTSTDAMAKNVVVVAFPAVLPLVHGVTFQEGPVDEAEIAKAFETANELYEDYIHLKTKAIALDESFFEGESKYPVPDTRDITYDHDLPLKLLLANRGTTNNTFGTMKQKVEQFRSKFKLNAPVVRSVPQEIATSHGDNASVDLKLVDKNENLMSFLQIFFSRP